MNLRDQLINEYFEWLCDMVSAKGFSKRISYRKLLTHLHRTDFRYSIPNDQNRAEDGASLRYRFALAVGHEDSVDIVLDILDNPCSVLEMILALAVRCEENIMDDPNIGDRTGQWFWGMIVNLGLGAMYDDLYDRQCVDETLNKFLDREYEPNGKGGLFTIRNCDRDIRTVEIWYQLCWYLDSIA